MLTVKGLHQSEALLQASSTVSFRINCMVFKTRSIYVFLLLLHHFRLKPVYGFASDLAAGAIAGVLDATLDKN